MPQYKVHWLGYSLEADSCIDTKDISTRILQDLLTNGSVKNTCKTHRPRNGRPGKYQRDETLAMIQKERDRVISLPAKAEEITTNANNITL